MSSLDTYRLCEKLILQIRLGYKTEWSKFAVENAYYKIYEEGINVASELFKLTGEEKYKKIAFNFIESSKAGVLSDAISESNAKKFSGIPDSLLGKERQINIDLAYYDTQIQKEQNKKDNIELFKASQNGR